MDRRFVDSLLASYPQGIPPSDIERVVRLAGHYALAEPRAVVPPVAVNHRPVAPPRPAATKPPTAKRTRGRPAGPRAAKPPAIDEAMVTSARAALAGEPMTVAHLEEAVGAPGLGFDLVLATGAKRAGEFEGADGSRYPLFSVAEGGR